jgi:hypothetical protein
MFDSNLVQNVFFYQTGGSILLWKYSSRQIYWYDFHISKLNNLNVIHDLYSQCLTQTLSKKSSNTNMEGVAKKLLWIEPTSAIQIVSTRDGTQNYGYPKTAITSDYHSHDGSWGFCGGFLHLFLWRKTVAKTKGYSTIYFFRENGQKSRLSPHVQHQPGHFRLVGSPPE